MDHSKLHKTSQHTSSLVNRKKDKLKRRSLAQKQQRNQEVDRRRNRPISPLKEVTNKENKKKSYAEKFQEWKAEKDRKKKMEASKAKPVFKVSSSIKYQDNLYSVLGSSKQKEKKGVEAHPVAHPKKKTDAAKTKPVTRSTRSASKVPQSQSRAATKPSKTENKNANSFPKTTRNTRQSKQTKENPKKRNKENKLEPVKEWPEEATKEKEEEFKENEPQSSNSSKADQIQGVAKASTTSILSESFAPVNFSFRAPTGLPKLPFAAVSKDGFNFLSSTPCDYMNVDKSKKPLTNQPPPFVLTSTSETSSDENTEIKKASSKKVDAKDTTKDNEQKASVEQLKSTEAETGTVENDCKKTEVSRFRNKVKTETEILAKSCSEWEIILENCKEELTEEVIGEIRTVNGQAQLLMSERFDQFSQLVDKFENPTLDGNQVNPSDLDGFWEMVYYQVDDVKNKFNELKVLKENNWIKEEEKKKSAKKRKATRKKTSKSSVAHRQAARKRLQEAREAMKRKREEEKMKDLEEVTSDPGESSGKIAKLDEDEDLGKENGTAGFVEHGDSLDIQTKRIVASSYQDATSSHQEEGMLTRSRRKTPGKNVSFLTPKSNKRKARFEMEPSDNEATTTTPANSQPRKRVMRKTPLPSSALKQGSSGQDTTTSGNEDETASPALKHQEKKVFRHTLISDVDAVPDIENSPMQGLKLNFDDVEDEEPGLDPIYLMPATMTPGGTESPPVTGRESGIDAMYFRPSDPNMIYADSLEGTPTLCATPGKSPGMILRSKRKSYHNPMSPFLPKKTEAGKAAASGSVDLMSFSPAQLSSTIIRNASIGNKDF